MPIRPNGLSAQDLKREITRAFGRRYFTRSDCVELLESLYKDKVTGYMYSTFIGKGYQIVRGMINDGSIASITRVELCLAGYEDHWIDQPTVLTQYRDVLEEIVARNRIGTEFAIADLVDAWEEDLSRRTKAVAFRQILARHLRRREIITPNNGRTFQRVR